ncbi:MAG TPA: CDP-alcohol phosphatidyltransferase family protein, partial [Chryseosolibacter sp.]|nr:CDP-alcohol phosphatidyltransferase family protein [Chryseosolibacter sp.]
MKRKRDVSDLKDIGILLFKSPTPVRIINLVTLYRIVTFPLLIFLIIAGHLEWFKWLLLASFLTDAIDGFIARRYQATSILGAKLDSIGDDLTVLAAAIGLFLTQQEFVAAYKEVFIILFALFLIQVAGAFYRYGKISTFHTYSAKIAAVVTAIFLLSV